jgi:hypothetical protein
MSDILSAPPILLIWLVGLVLALGLAGLGVWFFVGRKGRVSNRTWAVWSAASLLPASLTLWDMFHRADPGFVGSFVLVLETLLLTGVAIGFYLLGCRQRSSERNDRKAGRPTNARRLSWVLVGLNAAAAVWASHRIYECTALDDTAYLASLADWLPEPAHGVRAVTDRGGAIKLYSAVANPAAVVPNREALAAASAKYYLDRRIKRRDSSASTNCHGWVFTGGQYFVAPDDVEKILVENDYRLVASPSSGDLIIYRDDAGKIVHSGIVRLADGDLVIVESQWGAQGRYLHEPAIQAYSSRFEYYRSSRTGHEVHLIDAAKHES